MPRIFALIGDREGVEDDASMRPGHFAPDIIHRAEPVNEHIRASMRPGHFAPDIEHLRLVVACQRVASMRPGHFAPDIEPPEEEPGEEPGELQ